MDIVITTVMWCLHLCPPAPGDDHDVEGGGGGGKEPVQKTGDVRPPIAGTHNMPKGEGPASPTPLNPTAKQSTMEHTKLPKSPKRQSMSQIHDTSMGKCV